jgi:tRNA(His) 5'-end guanylyltransferase
MKSFPQLKLILLLTVGVLSLFGYAHGHTFTPDEDAAFLSLMDDIRSIILLIRSSGENVILVTEYSDNVSILLNSSTMKEINERNLRLGTSLSSSISELRNASREIKDDKALMIQDLIDETISSRIAKSDLENATIQSLTISLDLNKIIEYYSKAYDTASSTTNILGHTIMEEIHSNNASSSRSSTGSHNDNDTLYAMRSYNHSLSLFNVTTDRFNTELKDDLNSKDFEFLDNALADLKKKLNEKSTVNEISGIIHGQIQPTLQRIFKLTLK